jgi:hypothetical protein
LILRRRRFKRAVLAALVHPLSLDEALEELKANGDIEWYEMGEHKTVIIKLTKYSGLDMILKEESKPVVNPRPFVRNRLNAKTDRKIKS